MDKPITYTNTPGLSRRLVTFLHAALFVLGFSAVFIIGWGGAATVLGQLFVQYKTIIGQIGGVVVIGFGLATIGVVKVPWLYYDTRPDWHPGKRNSLIAATLMGVFFAAGWTPCIGTTLGAILTLGISQQTSGQAMLLSSGYALGLGIPFLLIGILMSQATAFLQHLRPYQRTIQIFSGIFLIGIGILLLSGRMILIAIWAQQHGFYINPALGGAIIPSYLIAILAGLISFVSPCVLPLIPAYVGYLSGQAVNNNLKHADTNSSFIQERR